MLLSTKLLAWKQRRPHLCLLFIGNISPLPFPDIFKVAFLWRPLKINFITLKAEKRQRYRFLWHIISQSTTSVHNAKICSTWLPIVAQHCKDIICTLLASTMQMIGLNLRLVTLLRSQRGIPWFHPLHINTVFGGDDVDENCGNMYKRRGNCKKHCCWSCCLTEK